MELHSKLFIVIVLAQLSLWLLPGSSAAQQTNPRIAAPEEIKTDFDAVPCQNKERLPAVRALFERMGASASDVSVDKFKDVENLVVRKQGASQEKVIIGAHYDKVSAGCGAVDNWTGIVTVAHLYNSLRGIPLKKTVLFVAFGKEEQGLIGSRAMAKAIGKDQAAQYCAMINIDSLGLAVPQIADNMSSRKLGAFAANLAKEMDLPFAHARIEGANADSTSFIEKKIPALTIHGLTNDWRSIIHGGNDQASKIKPESVYLGYRFALALAIRLDETSCAMFK